MHYADRGILLENTDGVVLHDGALDAQDGGGSTGIEVDADSSDNKIAEYDVSGFATDVEDAGTSNCWRLIHFTTGSIPTTGCP